MPAPGPARSLGHALRPLGQPPGQGRDASAPPPHGFRSSDPQLPAFTMLKGPLTNVSATEWGSETSIDLVGGCITGIALPLTCSKLSRDFSPMHLMRSN